MSPEIELSLVIEFDELFALRDRIRQIADNVRAQLVRVGFPADLEADVFDEELELRGPEGSRLLIRLDSYQLEILGAPHDLQVHLLAALILDEAGAFRLTSVEAGFALHLKLKRGHPIRLVEQAFSPIAAGDDEPMLDRRFSMTWDWGNATTGYSFLACDTEDRELFLSFKAREGYMTLTELREGRWMAEQSNRFDATVARFLQQAGLVE